MSPQLHRPPAPYIQITEYFRRAIEDGSLATGAKLPSVVEIARGWNVATATAAKAITQLRAEGYVRTNNQGTFVDVSSRLTTGPDRLRMLRTLGTGFRSGEQVEVLLSELVPADAEVAEALGVPEGSKVVCRRRVYRDDVSVVAVSTSWLPAEFATQAPELLRTEPLPTMTFGLVEERTGRRATRRRDVVAIRPVPPECATVFGLEPGTPALTMVNHYWDQNGDPTEYAVDFLGSGRSLYCCGWRKSFSTNPLMSPEPGAMRNSGCMSDGWQIGRASCRERVC